MAESPIGASLAGCQQTLPDTLCLEQLQQLLPPSWPPPQGCSKESALGAPSKEDGSAALFLLCGATLHTALLLAGTTAPLKNKTTTTKKKTQKNEKKERKKAESWWTLSAPSPQEDVGQLWRRLLQVGLEDPHGCPPGPTASSPDAAMSQARLLARFSIPAAWAGLGEAAGLGDPALSAGWEGRVSHREEGVCVGRRVELLLLLPQRGAAGPGITAACLLHFGSWQRPWGVLKVESMELGVGMGLLPPWPRAALHTASPELAGLRWLWALLPVLDLWLI